MTKQNKKHMEKVKMEKKVKEFNRFAQRNHGAIVELAGNTYNCTSLKVARERGKPYLKMWAI